MINSAKLKCFLLSAALIAASLTCNATDFQYVSFIDYVLVSVDQESDFKPSGKDKLILVNHLNMNPANLGLIKDKKYISTITQAVIFCTESPKYLPILKKFYSQEAGQKPILIEDLVMNQDKYDLNTIDAENIRPNRKFSIEETVTNYSCAKAATFDKSIKTTFKNPAVISNTISSIYCTYYPYSSDRRLSEKEQEIELGFEKNTGKIFGFVGPKKEPTLIGFSGTEERELRLPFQFYSESNSISINKQSGKLSGRINLQTLIADIKGSCSVEDKNLFASNLNSQKPVLDTEETKKKKNDPDAQSSAKQSQLLQPTVNSTDKRIALVIGNANYKYRPLRNPRNDADDISRSLRSSGFEVIDLRDASLQQMRAGVRQFGDRLINNDVGLVYYSGHGVEVKGRNYFIPVSADILREDEIADQGLDVSLILEKMNTAGKGVNILIVDACRDDPFGRSFRSSSRGLAQMDAPRGTIIAYATSPGKVASDGEGRNSPYTKNLVKAIQQPNKTIEQVFKEVRRAVQEETKNQQIPWENTSLSGDFYFRVQR